MTDIVGYSLDHTVRNPSAYRAYRQVEQRICAKVLKEVWWRVGRQLEEPITWPLMAQLRRGSA